MSTISYDVDVIGNNPDNFISAETHTINPINSPSYFRIVPRHHPFHAKDLSVALFRNGQWIELKSGIDYRLTEPYAHLNAILGCSVYGSIHITDSTLLGTISMDYRSFGGSQALDARECADQLLSQLRTDRRIDYKYIQNLPKTFPLDDHTHPMSDFYWYDDLLDRINAATNSIDPLSLSKVVEDYIPNANPDNVESFTKQEMSEYLAALQYSGYETDVSAILDTLIDNTSVSTVLT